jgi:hypothetical protein
MELRRGGRGRSFVMLNFSAEQVRPWWRILEALRFFGRGMADWW